MGTILGERNTVRSFRFLPSPLLLSPNDPDLPLPSRRLSEILSVPVPVLPSLASTASTSILGIGGSSFTPGEEIGGPGSLWIDEEDKKFYEELRELQGEVPASVLGIVKGKEEKGKEKEVEVEKEGSRIEVGEGEKEEETTEEDKEAEAERKDAEMEAGPEMEYALLFFPAVSVTKNGDLTSFTFTGIQSRP